MSSHLSREVAREPASRAACKALLRIYNEKTDDRAATNTAKERELERND